MTIEAAGDARVYGICRDYFVPAICGFGDARAAAYAARSAYLAEPRPSPN